MQTHTPIQTHMQTPTSIQTHLQTHTPIQTYMQTHTSIQTHMQTHTPIQTHMQTHTPMPTDCCVCFEFSKRFADANIFSNHVLEDTCRASVAELQSTKAELATASAKLKESEGLVSRLRKKLIFVSKVSSRICCSGQSHVIWN